ncbi:MAG: heparinase II/III family protein [Opitutaceae bacterium]|nr:heparinase II/III family protein [Opitutaceae bacterium]
MNANPCSGPTFTSFAHRAGPALERVQQTWSTGLLAQTALAVVPPARDEPVWAFALPVHASRQTMLFVDVVLDCGESPDQPVAAGYRTSFVVEWAGWNTMYFAVSSLKKIGEPAGLHAVRRVRFEAGSATFADTVLGLGALSWEADAPLIPVTPYEDMVVNFLSERMWSREDWTHTGSAGLPPEDRALDVAWMYANLRYVQKPGRRHQTAYTRRMAVDLAAYQAITLFTATDLRANFSLVLEIDGVSVRVIDRRRGLGGGDEMRALIFGRRLTALTIELEQAEDEICEVIDVQVASSIRWILLEKKGTDPLLVGQASGIPAVLLPAPVENPDTGLLPIGLFVGRDEFLRLRTAAQVPGPLKKMADEIIAEAVAHLEYQPEQYAGRYLPVDLGNQGCERRVSPADQMYHLNSCMVYGAMAYALTGDMSHAQTARRALFTAVRCTTWQAGFASRIPAGQPGYRAPFIETAVAEAIAACYDFIYPLLAEAERREVEDALYEKALPWIDMYLRLNGEGYLLNSNQGAVYTAGLVCAALVARRSHPDVDAILERGIQWFPRMMNNYYKVTGASNEGPGYWEYTTQYAVTALIAISRHKGWRVQDYAPAHLGRTMDYIMHTRSLARDRLSFLPMGDNIESIGYNFMNSSFMFFAKYYNDPNALWLWHEYFGRRPNAPGAPFFGKRMAGACSLSGLMDFLLFVEGAPGTPQLPPHKHFEVCDRIVLRTGCNYGDILCLFEGGPQTFDHTHDDKGQFIIEAYGERFAADPGVIRYQDPAHLFYKGTPYHNLVTLKSRNQDYRDPQHAVVLDRVACGGACDYVSADLRNSYKAFTKYRRRLLFVRPHYFLVLDDVAATEPGLEWNYHSCAPIERIDAGAGFIRLRGEKAGMTMAVGSLRPLVAAEGRYAADGAVLTHNLVLTQAEPVPAMTLAALLVPYPLGAALSEPQVTKTLTTDGVSYTVTGAWGTDRVECVLTGQPPADRPLIRVQRNQGGGFETVFETND